MKWRTEIKMGDSHPSMHYEDRILFLGSCFSDNIGQVLKRLKFQVAINPYGTLYNPFSIYSNVKDSLSGVQIKDADLVFHEGVYYHYNLHSSIGHSSKEKLVERIHQCHTWAKTHIKSANKIFITLGSALVFRLADSHAIVGNCHKQHPASFSREMLSVSTLSGLLRELISLIKSHNEGAHITFTVSPVRHLRDGLEANQLSKASLLLATAAVCAEEEACDYFPAYEIMIDDLRDYRFYEADLIHPNDQAIKYIWEKFQTYYIDPLCREHIKKVERVLNAIGHKAFYPDTDEHQAFLRRTLETCITLNQTIGGLNLDDEIAFLKKALTSR